MDQYETLPIVPLRDVVVFPHMMMPFVIGRPSSTRALEHAPADRKGDRLHTLLTTMRVPSTSTTWIGVPESMKSPSDTTST